MFLATLIEKEKYRYAYGRKFGSKRIETTEIKLPILPDNSPDWKWIENYVKNTLIPQLPHTAQEIFSDIFIHKSVSDKKLTLDTKSWKCFRYGDIFSIEK